MLHEIDELAGRLKRPVECPRGLIEILVQGYRKERREALLVNLSACLVSAEIDAHSKLVRHLRIVTSHVAVHSRRQFARFAHKTIDHIVRTPPVRLQALTVEKITPFQDHFRNPVIARGRPVMKHRIQKNCHHPGGGGAFELRLRGVVLRPVLAERAVWRSPVRRLLLMLVKCIDVAPGFFPIDRIPAQFPTVEHA